MPKYMDNGDYFQILTILKVTEYYDGSFDYSQTLTEEIKTEVFTVIKVRNEGVGVKMQQKQEYRMCPHKMDKESKIQRPDFLEMHKLCLQ